MVLVLLTSLNCCMSTLHLVHYALLLVTPACWKSNNTNVGWGGGGVKLTHTSLLDAFMLLNVHAGEMAY